MIQRVRFGTIENIANNMIPPRNVQSERLIREGLATPADWILRFSMELEDIPIHTDFPAVMRLSSLKWRYPDIAFRHLPAEEVKKPAQDLLVSRPFFFKDGWQHFAHNIMQIAGKVNHSHESEAFVYLPDERPLSEILKSPISRI